jgi:CspA family cold shock protein
VTYRSRPRWLHDPRHRHREFFDDKRGYGFLRPDDGGADVFVHRTGLDESCRTDQGLSLAEGQRACFDVIPTEKGQKATSVRLEQ